MAVGGYVVNPTYILSIVPIACILAGLAIVGHALAGYHEHCIPGFYAVAGIMCGLCVIACGVLALFAVMREIVGVMP